ncbi:ZIP family metal transporter [Methyloversatilis discipulorum]|uniref:ZIP family metal transporter n=1 Tax=Methyloversatilis discipulorum TaxID=1119528 RepID=UPI001A4AACB7|nr:ZIP family metal transporter [Methyloversatilis discipulorum]MBL8470001.1 ZIP family metal transporter [Methyloversatilis discipulorum]
MLAQTLLFSLIGSLGAIAGSALLLLSGPRRRESLLPALISYATGTLLGAAFLGMLLSSLQQAPAHAVSATVLAGIVLFFALEKAVLWRHCHDAGCPAHGATGPLILIGDAFHNFVDGVVIAAAFHVSPDVGVATAIAVIAHELPQEVGDFALLLGHGYGARKALLLNALSASATLPGALLCHFALAEARAAVPWVLALSAASFIYIAVSDLMPRLHRTLSVKESLRDGLLLLLGIATIALLRMAH